MHYFISSLEDKPGHRCEVRTFACPLRLNFISWTPFKRRNSEDVSGVGAQEDVALMRIGGKLLGAVESGADESERLKAILSHVNWNANGFVKVLDCNFWIACVLHEFRRLFVYP